MYWIFTYYREKKVVSESYHLCLQIMHAVTVPYRGATFTWLTGSSHQNTPFWCSAVSPAGITQLFAIRWHLCTAKRKARMTKDGMHTGSSKEGILSSTQDVQSYIIYPHTQGCDLPPGELLLFLCVPSIWVSSTPLPKNTMIVGNTIFYLHDPLLITGKWLLTQGNMLTKPRYRAELYTSKEEKNHELHLKHYKFPPYPNTTFGRNVWTSAAALLCQHHLDNRAHHRWPSSSLQGFQDRESAAANWHFLNFSLLLEVRRPRTMLSCTRLQVLGIKSKSGSTQDWVRALRASMVM